jgi:hypothetical protein
MPQSPAHRAVAAATVSLLAFVGCVCAFLPPFVERTVLPGRLPLQAALVARQGLFIRSRLSTMLPSLDR